MKFRFSLEGVKKAFIQKQNQAQVEMGKAIQKKKSIEQQIEKAVLNGSKLGEGFQTGQQHTGFWIQALSEMLERNDGAVSELEQKLHQANSQCEEKKEILHEVNRRKLSLEKLEMRQRDEFRIVSTRKEQKQLDDICAVLRQVKR